MATALVTGPTAGIGLALAGQLAGHGHDLILVARDEQRLNETAERLQRQFRVQCTPVAADLSNRADTDAVAALLADPEQPIEWLVNNAGSSVREGFADSGIDAEQAMLDLLVTAPMRLTHAALPGMLRRGRGRVLIVSSVAGFLPGGTYSAAKAWATTFAEGLSGQFRSRGVHVTALCPGFTHTEFHQRAGLDVSAVPEVLWQDAEEVAAAGLSGCSRGKAVVVPGLVYMTIREVARLTPRALQRRAMSAL